MKTAKTNVKHIEQARAEITFNGKKALMSLDWEKPSRFYIHVRGNGVNKVISEEFDPRAILQSWTKAMKKYGGELVARTPKQRDLLQKQRQLAAGFKLDKSACFASEFLRELRKAYLKDIRDGASFRDSAHYNREMTMKLVKKGWKPEDIVKQWPRIWGLNPKGQLKMKPEGKKMEMAGVAQALKQKRGEVAAVDPEWKKGEDQAKRDYKAGKDLKVELEKLRKKGYGPMDAGYASMMKRLVNEIKVPGGRDVAAVGKDARGYFVRAPNGVKTSFKDQTKFRQRLSEMLGSSQKAEKLVKDLDKKKVSASSIPIMASSKLGIHVLSSLAQNLASKSSRWERLDSHGRGHPAKHYKAIDQKFGARSAQEYGAFDALYNHHLRSLLDDSYQQKANNLSYINKMLKDLASRYKLNLDWSTPKKGMAQAGDKEVYRVYFDKKMKEWGISSPDELDDDKKRKFFEEVDKGWKSDKEGSCSKRHAAKEPKGHPDPHRDDVYKVWEYHQWWGRKHPDRQIRLMHQHAIDMFGQAQKANWDHKKEQRARVQSSKAIDMHKAWERKNPKGSSRQGQGVGPTKVTQSVPKTMVAKVVYTSGKMSPVKGQQVRINFHTDPSKKKYVAEIIPTKGKKLTLPLSEITGGGGPTKMKLTGGGHDLDMLIVEVLDSKGRVASVRSAYVSKWRKKVRGKPFKKGKLKVNIHGYGGKGDPIEVYDSGEKFQGTSDPIYILLDTKTDQAMPVSPEDLPKNVAAYAKKREAAPVKKLTLKAVRNKIYQYKLKDYKGRWNGQKSVLNLNKQTGATELVKVDDLTPEEMVDQLRFMSKAKKDLGFEEKSDSEILNAIKGLK